MAVAIRAAAPDDRLAVLRVLDAAMLETDADLDERIEAGTVLVAADPDVDRDADPDADRDANLDADADSIVGALVAETCERGAHVDAVAVRRRRRAAGIGSMLVEHAAERWRPLTVDFDERVKPFYDSLGFQIERDGERYRAILD